MRNNPEIVQQNIHTGQFDPKNYPYPILYATFQSPAFIVTTVLYCALSASDAIFQCIDHFFVCRTKLISANLILSYPRNSVMLLLFRNTCRDIAEVKMQVYETVKVIPSSSLHSRTMHCSPVSPASILPPGNSHNKPQFLSAGRWHMRIFPFCRIIAAVTSSVFMRQPLS